MQAYLSQEFPLGLTDLRLHPVGLVEDPAEDRDGGVEARPRPACAMGYWRLALALLP